MRLDALKSSHPIQVPINHAEEVEEVFDAISYCKGGSVVKMIRAVLGIAKFQKGLANYMKKHAYGNTETFDLWKAWEESSGMPVQEMMASWTEQMGFPLVTVTGEKWENDKVTLTLEQEWFFVGRLSSFLGGSREEMVHSSVDMHISGNTARHYLHERKDGYSYRSPAIQGRMG